MLGAKTPTPYHTPKPRLSAASVGKSTRVPWRARPLTQAIPKPVVASHIESMVLRPSSTSEAAAPGLGARGCQHEDAHARATAGPVEEADSEGSKRASPDSVGVAVARAVLVRVEVSVNHAVSMDVIMDVVGAAPPAHDQPHGERDDQNRHSEPGRLLSPIGQADAEQDDRKPKSSKRDGMPQAPPHANPPGGTIPAAGDERGQRSQVVGVCCMAEAQQDSNEDDETNAAAAAELHDAFIETKHGPPTLA